jgi:hypothetical protein
VCSILTSDAKRRGYETTVAVISRSANANAPDRSSQTDARANPARPE